MTMKGVLLPKINYDAPKRHLRNCLRFLSAPVRILALPLFRLLPRANNGYYYVKLGDAFMDLRLYSLACNCFEHSLVEGGEQEHAWSHMQLGFALFQAGHHDEALLHYRKSYLLWPDPIWAAQVAWVEHHCGHDDKARDMLDVAMKDPSMLDKESLRSLDDLRLELEKNSCG